MAGVDIPNELVGSDALREHRRMQPAISHEQIWVWDHPEWKRNPGAGAGY